MAKLVECERGAPEGHLCHSMEGIYLKSDKEAHPENKEKERDRGAVPRRDTFVRLFTSSPTLTPAPDLNCYH